MNYHFSKDFGKLIRERRLSIGLSQKKLADGICSQAELSRIENEQGQWSQLIKLELANRLGIDVRSVMQQRDEYVQEVVRQINLHKRRQDYEGLAATVKAEKQTPLARDNLYLKQILAWHEGICHFKVHHDLDSSMDILQKALDLTNVSKFYYSTVECDILNSIALVWYDSGQYERALTPIEQAFSSFHHTPHYHDIRIISKIYYSLARTHTKRGDFQISIKLCQKALAACREKESSYLYGELLYQIGWNYMLLKQRKEAHYYFGMAKDSFTLRMDFRYVSYISSKMEQLKLEMNEC